MGKISLVMNAPTNGKWQFSTLLNFEKSKTKSDLFMLYSKIGHQIDYFGKIEINSKFRPCRQMILEIYRDWLLILVRRWHEPHEPLYGYLRLSISSAFFHQIVDFSTKSSLEYQKLFFLISVTGI